MVVFMDQLTQQTPPVAEKLPVIGQVSNNYQDLSTSDCPGPRVGRPCPLIVNLVLCGITFDCLIFDDDNDLLLATSLCCGTKACPSDSSKNFQNSPEIPLPSCSTRGQ